jgi:hypothetical protein
MSSGPGKHMNGNEETGGGGGCCSGNVYLVLCFASLCLASLRYISSRAMITPTIPTIDGDKAPESSEVWCGCSGGKQNFVEDFLSTPTPVPTSSGGCCGGGAKEEASGGCCGGGEKKSGCCGGGAKEEAEVVSAPPSSNFANSFQNLLAGLSM